MSEPVNKFMLQTEADGTFEERGLRDYFSYRDLGMLEATGGRVMAQINRAKAAVTEEGGKHHHVVDFQMNYVLKGWAKMNFEGIGEVLMEAGTAMHMPPGIKHTFVSCSDDFETLEICLPGDFATVEDEE